MFEELLQDAYDKIAEIGSKAQDIGTYIANFDGTISRSVGKGGQNDPKDVLAIRMLLNGFIASDPRMKALNALDIASPINGWSDMDPTVTAIIWFQREVAGFQKPDGKVDPNGKTHTILKGLNWKKPASKPKDTHDEVGAKPVPLAEAQVKWYSQGGSVSLETYKFPPGSIVTAGETWLAVDGERIIYQASHSHIVYSLLKPRNAVRPGAYIQATKWFAADVALGTVGSEVGRRCAHIRQLMLIECEFFIGLGCALYLPAALFMMTMELGPFILNNYQKWPIICRIIVLLPDLVGFMTHHTPTLLKFIIWSIVYKLMDHVTGVLGDERAVARLAGGMIGKLGMAGFESTIRSLGYALGVIKDILQFVLIQNGKLSAAEMTARVKVIKEVALKVGNAIDDATAAKIVGEIAASAVQLAPIVSKTHQEIVRLGL